VKLIAIVHFKDELIIKDMNMDILQTAYRKYCIVCGVQCSMKLALEKVNLIYPLCTRPTSLIVIVHILVELIIKDINIGILQIAVKTITVECIMAVRFMVRVI